MEGKYGEWTILGPSPDKKYYSRCECSCGVVKDVKNSHLRLGYSKSCGHSRGDEFRKSHYEESDKAIIGKRFGKLVALKRANNTGPAKYLCKCDCGNESVVLGALLKRGGTVSCGCVRKELSVESMEKIMDEGHKKNKEGHVEETNLYNLTEEISKNNTTGVKGVSKMKNGKYRAYINLKRKQKHLGTFDTIEEAAEARLQAEEELYNPIIEKYKAKEDN